MSHKHILLIGLALIAYIVSLRLLPHPPNFAPLAAVAIFAGAKLPRRYALGIVLAAAIISDAMVGFYNLPVMLTVWTSYLVIALASRCVLSRPTWLKGGFVVAGSSLFFFAATNLAVWAGGSYYPHTLAGLAECFTMALPFLRNTLLGDLTYTAVLFAMAALVINVSSISTQYLRIKLNAN